MKVLYDYQAFYMQKFGGVSNCFVQLIKELPKNIEYDIAVCESDNIHLKDSGLVDVRQISCSEETFISKKRFKGRRFLYNICSEYFPDSTSLGRNRRFSIDALKRGDFDVFHPTFFDCYFLPYLNKTPFVLTVHDMIPEHFGLKNEFQAKMKPLLCREAAHIIAVSNKTKKDLIDLLGISENKISVIYHGSSICQKETDSGPLINGKYILYVGRRDFYKGFLQMMKSLAPVLMRHPELTIVCTGSEFMKDELSLLKKMCIEDKVFQLHVDDKGLQNLYSHALCFIYPSLYEGFGIPILEAYSARCPVLLNYASCFPEIAQDAAIYFHMDFDSSDLEQVMEIFLSWGDAERDKLIKKQLDRLQYFSWKKSAEQLTDIYTSIK